MFCMVNHFQHGIDHPDSPQTGQSGPGQVSVGLFTNNIKISV